MGRVTSKKHPVEQASLSLTKACSPVRKASNLERSLCTALPLPSVLSLPYIRPPTYFWAQRAQGNTWAKFAEFSVLDWNITMI